MQSKIMIQKAWDITIKIKTNLRRTNTMKKIVSLVAILAVFAMLLVGCTAKFDMDKSIEKLKNEGLTEGMCYITEEECERATSLTNSEIAFMGGEFTVEIVKQYGLIENGDYSKSCTFITFATEEQATNFAELNIEYFAKGENSNNWRIARDGCVVVLTNLDVAMDIINLEFK